MKLEGKVAIVTGGSRGIGACIARRYGREGATVAVVGNTRRDRAEAVVAEIEAAGGKAQAFLADIGVVADCERLAREVIAAFGTVDILVNSAGIFTPLPIEEVTEENWDAQHALHLKGAFFLTKAVVPTMKAKGAGKIINISSHRRLRRVPELQRLLRVEGRSHQHDQGALPRARWLTASTSTRSRPATSRPI